LIFDFYDLNKTDGFYPAFEETFEMSVEEFYQTVDEFLALPHAKQIQQLAG